MILNDFIVIKFVFFVFLNMFILNIGFLYLIVYYVFI